MRPRRKAPVRQFKKSAGGGSNNYFRFLTLFVAAGVLFWVLSARNEVVSSSLQAISKHAQIAGSRSGVSRFFQSSSSSASSSSASSASATSAKDAEVFGYATDAGLSSLSEISGRDSEARNKADADELAEATVAQVRLATAEPTSEEAVDSIDNTIPDSGSSSLAHDTSDQERVQSANTIPNTKLPTTTTSTTTAAPVFKTVKQDAATRPEIKKRRKKRSKAAPAQWAPVNGSFPNLSFGKPKKRTLKSAISSKKLVRVFLDATRFQENNPGKVDPPLEATRGRECPVFEYGFEGFPGIASCWRNPIEDVLLTPASLPANCANLTDRECMQEADKQPHERWSAQVLLLHNVFLNTVGQVFNQTHLFDHNGCAADRPFDYRPSVTRLTHFPTLLSLVDWFGWSTRAYLLDFVPSIVSLDTVLPLLRGVPVAFGQRVTHKTSQVEVATGFGHRELVGPRLERMNPQILKEGELFFAESLVLPLHQRCGRPSRAMWSYMRNKHMLPKAGLPLYKHEFKSTFRKVRGEDLSAGPDWVVVLAMRNEWKPLLQQLKVEQQLLKWIPRERVVVYRDGSLPFAKRKELMNRARLLVAAHDNVLADMVFMPARGAVLEVRQIEDPDPTFHHLADACHLDYYLTFSDGRKADGRKGGKPKVKDLKVVNKLIEKVARRIRKN